MKRVAVAMMLFLLCVPASAQNALSFSVPGDGVVTLEGNVSGVARFYGVSVVGPDTGVDPECRATYTTFVCTISAPAFVSIPYLPTAPRCGVRPTLRWRAGDVSGVAYGPEPGDVTCAYVPAVAR